MLFRSVDEETALLSSAVAAVTEVKLEQTTDLAGSQTDDGAGTNNVDQSNWYAGCQKLGDGQLGLLDEKESVFWNQLIERLVYAEG